FYKKRHPYERLKKKRRSFAERINAWFFKPGSIRPVIYFAVADYRAGNFKSPMQVVSFFTRYTNPIALVSGVAAAGVGASIWGLGKTAPGRWIKGLVAKADERGEKIWEKSQKRLESANSLMSRISILRKQMRGYRRMFNRLNPGPED